MSAECWKYEGAARPPAAAGGHLHPRPELRPLRPPRVGHKSPLHRQQPGINYPMDG